MTGLVNFMFHIIKNIFFDIKLAGGAFLKSFSIVPMTSQSIKDYKISPNVAMKYQ